VNTPSVIIANTPLPVTGTSNVTIVGSNITQNVAIVNTPLPITGNIQTTISQVAITGNVNTVIVGSNITQNVSVVNTPNVNVANTPNVYAVQSGTWNVGVNNFPSTQNVGIVSSSITQNVAVVNTPNVNVANTPTVNVGNSPNINNILNINKVRLGSVKSTLVGANTNVFASNLTATLNGFIYILTSTNISGTLMTVSFNGLNSYFNNGNPLNSNTWYDFAMQCMAGDYINISFNTTGTVTVYVDNALL
jgi:hypothetical protein